MVTLTTRKSEARAEVAPTPPKPGVLIHAEEIASRPAAITGHVWGALRLGMGWIFFWAFLDKVFGLGYSTASEGAWIDGGSPTNGFLSFATKGPFADIYKGMAGNVAVDWLFMIGLLVIGLPLLLGIGVRLAAITGVAMLLFMFTAGFILPEHNPILDEHIIYAMIMVGLIAGHGGYRLGLGRWWANTKLVRRFSILE